MQTTTTWTRNHTRHLWVIGAVLVLVLTGATITALAVSRSGSSERTSIPAPVAGDMTTLALDRDGADLFPTMVGTTPNTTDMNPDLVGADTLPRLLHDAPDTTTLNLDRNGSDYTSTPNHPGFINPSTDGTDMQ